MLEIYAFFAASIDFVLLLVARLLSKVKRALVGCQGEERMSEVSEVNLCGSECIIQPVSLCGSERIIQPVSLCDGERRIQPFSQEDLTRKMDYYEGLSGQMWNMLHKDTENGISVWSLKPSEPATHSTFKIEASFPCEEHLTVEGIFNQYWNQSARFKWDPNCMRNSLIQQLSPDSRIVHFKSKPVWPATSRDAVMLNQRNLKHLPRMADNLFVESEAVNVPLDRGTVRMKVEFQGQRIRLQDGPDGRSQIKILQMIVGNPNGWIPEAIVKRITTKSIPAQMLRVKELAIEEKRSTSRVNSSFSTNVDILARLQVIEGKLDAVLAKKPKKIDFQNITGSFIGCLLVHIISYSAVKRLCAVGNEGKSSR